MNFGGLVKDGKLQRQLTAAFGGDRLPNAALLEGGTAEERRGTALLLARAALCSGAGERPCGVCPNCVKALAGSTRICAWRAAPAQRGPSTWT